jgi:hypothetical protein
MGTDHEVEQISVFEFDVAREAFGASIPEQNIAEVHWASHARHLFQELVDRDPDDRMISRIIGRG